MQVYNAMVNTPQGFTDGSSVGVKAEIHKMQIWINWLLTDTIIRLLMF